MALLLWVVWGLMRLLRESLLPSEMKKQGLIRGHHLALGERPLAPGQAELAGGLPEAEVKELLEAVAVARLGLAVEEVVVVAQVKDKEN